MSVFLRIYVLKSSGGGFCRPCVGRRSVERRVVRVRESGRDVELVTPEVKIAQAEIAFCAHIRNPAACLS